jgi:hypothetical protein
MTPMRLGLIALGCAFIVVVWLFNKWQERRVQKGVEGRFARNADDVLLGTGGTAPRSGERSEPSLGPSGERRAADGHEQREPMLGAPPRPEPAAYVPIDEGIHAISSITAEQPLPSERWLQALHGVRHAGRQSVVFEADTVLGGAPLEGAARCSTVRIGVQLANRSGPLNEIEFSEFVATLQQVAETLGATCDVPDMMETVARARALDARCAPLDALVGINIACANGMWSVAEVVEAARGFGLQPRSDQRLVAYGPAAETLFVLQDGEGDVLLGERAMTTTTRVTLLLEVPRVARELHAFDQMKGVATLLAEKLGGILVDDQLHTLTESALLVIGRQLAPVYTHLEEAGAPAGSPRALALFR